MTSSSLVNILSVNNSYLHLAIFIAIMMIALIILMQRSSKSKILLGRRGFLPFYLDLNEAKHIVIFGITGSGKTNTAKLIVESFKGSKLILDWNGEYLIGRVAKPSDISIRNLSTLEFCEALASSLQLTAPQYAMLLEVARDSINLCEIIEKLKKYPIESDTRREIRNALLRRLEPLSYFNLFSGNLTINDIDTIDLSGLTYDAKRLVANVIVRLIYNNPAKQLVVLEEAQNLLTPRRLDQPPTSCELILDEIRKHGVRVLAIAQIPSLVSTTYRNAEYIIVHRLSLTPEEARNLGLSDDERERIAKLRNGQCLVIHRGKKTFVKVFKAHIEVAKPTIKDEEKHSKEAEPLMSTTKIKKINDYELLPCIIEDLKEINEWRKNVTISLELMSKEINELKQLTRGLVDKVSSLKAVERIRPHEDLNEKLKHIKSNLESRIEGLELSLNYVKERILDLEEVLKNFKGGSK